VGVGVYVVGRPRDPALGAAIVEYEQRAAHYWDLTVVEVKGGGASGGDGPEVVQRREGERLVERIPAAAQLVLCDVGGERLDSVAFAAWLLERRDLAQSVAFVIGGAHGVSPALRARARRRLALAPWTLPHELARLVLMEQIYRAGTIGRGEPYHK
jgi:23S rRNA (pseudouridine1915-N3)-methyltransferase